MLQSKLFKSNKRLNDCATSDPAHVRPGDKGDHVKLIQVALQWFSPVKIDQGELSAGFYGKATANSVLHYKRSRNIVNHAYQNVADDIVGKMTIKTLDDEVVEEQENGSSNLASGGLRPIIGRII